MSVHKGKREWWEGDKHTAVITMTEVLCLTWLSIWTYTGLNTLGWFHWVQCFGTWHAISQYAQRVIGC